MELCLRASLFALAREIDFPGDRIVYEDWTKPKRTPSVDVSLAENAILNLFLMPQSVMSAAAQIGRAEDEIANHIASLQGKGLLLTEAAWQAERLKHPYVNLPSLWAGMPTPATPFDSYDDAYAHDFVPWNQLPVATDLLSLAPLPMHPKPQLLDVGCGTGHNLALMEQLGFQCSGIDIAQSAIAQLKAKARAPERFVAGSVTDLPWPDGSFDVVVDIGCLHCLQSREIERYIAEARRVLRPGGRFLCRSFKPRDNRLLEAQPVKMERLGYSPDEVLALFSSRMPVQLVKEGPVHGYYLGA